MPNSSGPIAIVYGDLVFNVDVIHYIKQLPTFFQEARRVLKTGGTLLIATDSDSDLRNRSLTHFFPEILEHELARYPKATALHAAAGMAGFAYQGAEHITGERPITDAYVENLAAQCSSALRFNFAGSIAGGLRSSTHGTGRRHAVEIALHNLSVPEIKRLPQSERKWNSRAQGTTIICKH